MSHRQLLLFCITAHLSAPGAGLDQRRRNDPKAVTVSNVNINVGGQTIVGNVQNWRPTAEGTKD